jgi:hypothetical protein
MTGRTALPGPLRYAVEEASGHTNTVPIAKIFKTSLTPPHHDGSCLRPKRITQVSAATGFPQQSCSGVLKMKAMSRLIRCSLALGVLLLAAVLTFGGTFAYAGALDTPTAGEAAANGNANIAERPDALFCITYSGGDQTCIVEAALEALNENEAGEADQASSLIIEAAPAIDAGIVSSLAPETFFVDAIKVEITQSVTIVVPGDYTAENDEPATTGSIPTELNDASEAETLPGIAGAN